MSAIPQVIRRLFSKAFSAAGKEVEAIEQLHAESKATVRRMAEEDPGLRKVLDGAHAYAVFPSVGKATAVIGGAYGKGEVFQGDSLVGYAGLVQLTLGVQVGGQTFSEVVAFQNSAALERFKSGKTAFAANASAVLVKAGAAASSNYADGTLVFVSPEGGMMLEAAIGAQKFIFKPAALGRAKEGPEADLEAAKPDQSAKKQAPKQSSRRPGKSAKTSSRRSKAQPHRSAKRPRPAARRNASHAKGGPRAKSQGRRPAAKARS